MKTIALIMLVGVYAFFFSASEVHACMCTSPKSVSDARKQADAVFAGTVTSIERLRGDALDIPSTINGGSRVTFDVSRVWKGPKSTSKTVLTSQSGGACGFDFKEGSEYLVFASNTPVRAGDAIAGRNDVLVTHICSGTRQILAGQSASGIMGGWDGQPPYIQYFALAGAILVVFLLVRVIPSLRQRPAKTPTIPPKA